MLTNLSSMSIFDYIYSKVRVNDMYAYFILKTGEILDETTFNKISPVKFKDTARIENFVILCQIWDLMNNTKYERGLLEYNSLEVDDFSIEYFNLTTYFPIRFGTLNQNFIYNFKNGKNSEYYANIFSEVITDLFCGNKNLIETVTILPIPASTRYKTEIRYKRLFELISEKTGVINGYDIVETLNDVQAKHLNNNQDYEEDHLKFNLEKLKSPVRILIIDDVITRGHTLKDFVKKLTETLKKEKKINNPFIKGLLLSKTIDWDIGIYLQEQIGNPEDIVYYLPKENRYKPIKDYNIEMYIDNNKKFILEKGFEKIVNIYEKTDPSVPEDSLYKDGIIRYSTVNNLKLFYFVKYYSKHKYENIDISFLKDIQEGRNTEYYADIFSKELIKLFGKYKTKDNKPLLETMTLVLFNSKNTPKFKNGEKLFELISEKTGIINGYKIIEKIPKIKIPQVHLEKIKTPRRLVILDGLFEMKIVNEFYERLEINNILPSKISIDDSFTVFLSLYRSTNEMYTYSPEIILDDDFNIFVEN